MLLWQKSMIALARNEKLAGYAEKSRCMRFFSGRFVGGEDTVSALACAKELRARNVNASLFYLGEYVDDAATVARCLRELTDIIRTLDASGLDVHVSVDPTQVGAMQNWDVCRENVAVLARQFEGMKGKGHNVVMIDMEDSSVTTRTLDMFHHLRSQDLPVAVTMQTYLHRSLEDLEGLVDAGAMVRLVKGAFAESGRIAVTGRQAKDASYRRGIDRLFSLRAKQRGVRPVLGTHDHRMIHYAAEVAERNGWRQSEWEIEMLFGVRPGFQKKLVEQGFSLRLYVPFGKSWWPYSVRRIGENPGNAWFVMRSFLFNMLGR